MARSVETDPYHDFRFHLVDPAGGNLDTVAGFTTVTMPEVTVEEAPYREGTFIWTQKYPGVPSVSDITLNKGIFKRDSDFFNWVLKVVNGGQEYRTELVLQQFHITDEFGINGTPSRVTRLREVWGKQAKPTSDMDATSSNVSLQNLVISVEEIEVEIISN
jgi:phage tail-like protein